MIPFVQLYETAYGTVDSSGNLTITVTGPRLNRTWIGSVTILDVPPATGFSVSVGAQAYGTLYAPGPGGPFELLTGQNFVATASGLTPGLVVTALLAGADYAKNSAPPYFGPSLATAVAQSGGTGPVVFYSSLIGPGEGASPGDLKQTGKLTIDGALEVNSLDNVTVNVPAGKTIEFGQDVTIFQMMGDAIYLWGTVVIGYDTTNQIGFYGSTGVARAAHPTTLADVITLLTNLGLCA